MCIIYMSNSFKVWILLSVRLYIRKVHNTHTCTYSLLVLIRTYMHVYNNIMRLPTVSPYTYIFIYYILPTHP